jgi:acetylornithine deacetylase/succinyl-diaminopimelate desuccinylase-like protein
MNPTTQLLETIRRYEPQMIDFCSRLIQVRSVNGVDMEQAAAECVAAEADRLGLGAQLIASVPNRPNVIVSTAPEGQTGLLLLGHLDTVPAGDAHRWTYPPFSGTVADGKIYGRGAIDTKGGITAALYALASLSQTPGALPSGSVQLLCFPDEESGATGELGVKFLHREGLLVGKGAIYAYSGNQITLGHRGLIRYRLTCTGEAVHTGANEWQERSTGANAVTGMARLLLALESLEFPYSQTPYFEAFKMLITPGTVIKGGTSINVVPDTCTALVDARLTPEYSRAAMDAALQQCIADVTAAHPKLRFDVQLLNYAPAAITGEHEPIVTALAEAIEQVKGQPAGKVVAGPTNEGYLLIERGIPTICGMGPTGANAHAVDEYVDIAGMVDAAAIFALTAQKLSAYP